MSKNENLFLGYGRLVKTALERPFFRSWQTLSRSQTDATYQGDFLSFSEKDFPMFHTVVFALAPLHKDETAYRRTYEECLAHALSILRFQKFIFCGSTVVYPSVGYIVSEDWHEEYDQCHEKTYFRASVLKNAEKILYHHAFSRTVILRFSGLFDSSQERPFYRGNRISLKKAAYFLEQAAREQLDSYQVFHISDPAYLSESSFIAERVIYPLKAFSQWGSGAFDD